MNIYELNLEKKIDIYNEVLNDIGDGEFALRKMEDFDEWAQDYIDTWSPTDFAQMMMNSYKEKHCDVTLAIFGDYFRMNIDFLIETFTEDDVMQLIDDALHEWEDNSPEVLEQAIKWLEVEVWNH